jgi:hypothetical protein
MVKVPIPHSLGGYVPMYTIFMIEDVNLEKRILKVSFICEKPYKSEL